MEDLGMQSVTTEDFLVQKGIGRCGKATDMHVPCVADCNGRASERHRSTPF